MNRSLVRAAVSTCAAAALTFAFLAVPASSPAQAATFTLNDPNCSNFSYDPPTNTLTCVVSAPPVCTVTGPTTGTINQQNTMTASCSPAATSWVWSSDVGSGCNAQTNQSCNDTQTAAGTVNYKVQGTNGQGQGPLSAAYPVVWSSTPPAKPSGCTIVQSNPSGTLPVGGASPTLTANCTTGGAVTWLWAGGAAAGQTTAAVAPLVTSTTTFTATATNSAGSTATTYTVQVNTGGGGGPISCAGFNNTLVINVTWGVTAQTFTNQNGGFNAGDALVLKFTTPANGGALTKKGGVVGYEYGGPPGPRYGTLSTQPCDFPASSTDTTHAVSIAGGGLGVLCYSGQSACSTAVSMGYTFNPLKVANALLLPNTTYYINIANKSGSCGINGQSCDMGFNWTWFNQ